MSRIALKLVFTAAIAGSGAVVERAVWEARQRPSLILREDTGGPEITEADVPNLLFQRLRETGDCSDLFARIPLNHADDCAAVVAEATIRYGSESLPPMWENEASRLIWNESEDLWKVSVSVRKLRLTVRKLTEAQLTFVFRCPDACTQIETGEYPALSEALGKMIARKRFVTALAPEWLPRLFAAGPPDANLIPCISLTGFGEDARAAYNQASAAVREGHASREQWQAYLTWLHLQAMRLGVIMPDPPKQLYEAPGSPGLLLGALGLHPDSLPVILKEIDSNNNVLWDEAAASWLYEKMGEKSAREAVAAIAARPGFSHAALIDLIAQFWAASTGDADAAFQAGAALAGEARKQYIGSLVRHMARWDGYTASHFADSLTGPDRVAAVQGLVQGLESGPEKAAWELELKSLTSNAER